MLFVFLCRASKMLLLVTETLCDMNVRVQVNGGGKSAQAGAVNLLKQTLMIGLTFFFFFFFFFSSSTRFDWRLLVLFKTLIQIIVGR